MKRKKKKKPISVIQCYCDCCVSHDKQISGYNENFVISYPIVGCNKYTINKRLTNKITFNVTFNTMCYFFVIIFQYSICISIIFKKLNIK